MPRRGALMLGSVGPVFGREGRMGADGTSTVVIQPMFVVLIHRAGCIEIGFLLKILERQIDPGGFARPRDRPD
jgi:hypothetical protein